MKTILITSALPAELKIVKDEIKKIGFKDLKIDFFATGMGNYKTILNLTKKLSDKEYDFVVNIGVCGHNFEGGKQSKLLQVARIYNLSLQKELLVPVFLKFGELGSIASSEKPIFDNKDMLLENYVDMESYGFELVTNDFQVPRILLKIPVDKVGEETKNFDFNLAKQKLKESINYKELIKKIYTYLDGVPQKDDLTKYENYYKMTFTEKIIFARLYNKYNTFNKTSFRDFFEKNKSLEKKGFFKLLQNSGLSI